MIIKIRSINYFLLTYKTGEKNMASESELPQEMVGDQIEDQPATSVFSQHACSRPVRYLCLPRVITEGRTHEIIKRMADMMRVSLVILHVSDPRLGRRVVSYRTQKTGAGAVRAAYVTPPHVKCLENK